MYFISISEPKECNLKTTRALGSSLYSQTSFYVQSLFFMLSFHICFIKLIFFHYVYFYMLFIKLGYIGACSDIFVILYINSNIFKERNIECVISIECNWSNIFRLVLLLISNIFHDIKLILCNLEICHNLPLSKINCEILGAHKET